MTPKKRNGTLFRAACIALMAVFLMASLSGCTSYRPLRLSQMREFEQKVRAKYPFSIVKCQYHYGAGVNISVTRFSFDQECVYTILGYLKPIVCDEEFIEDLFELYEGESHNDPNWKRGYRPRIWLNLYTHWGDSSYQFSTTAYLENYNSGFDPESYTWDGYTTWWGTEHIKNGPGHEDDGYREIAPKEIERAVERYSADAPSP